MRGRGLWLKTNFFGIWAFFITFVVMFLTSGQAMAAITVTPATWNMVGLDSNTPMTGPKNFPIGAKVCNTGAVAATNVAVSFTWDSANPYINLRPGSLSTLNFASIPAGACVDAYFEAEVTQTAAAFDTVRNYHITATDVTGTYSSPVPRQLYVEHLVSQSRNYITDVAVNGVSVPAGGAMNLIVGQTYTITLYGGTAIQGYNQFEEFINFPNTIFQILSVNTSYSANSSPYVTNPNPSLYADACRWENDPNSPLYRSCTGGSFNSGGNNVVTTYVIKIVGGGGTSQTLNTLLYDFSGSSFHYNADYAPGFRIANIIDPTSVTITKKFTPNPTNVGGVSTLTFVLNNPNPGPVTGVNFTDPLPAPMIVAASPSVVTNGCGTPVFAPAGGDVSLSFSGATIAANSICTVMVNVTPPATGTYINTTNHLFVDTIDTGRFATDTLTVNNAPPPPPPACGFQLAQWTIPAGSLNPPPATTIAPNVATATAVALVPANTAIGAGGGWNTYGYKTLGQYVQFTVDTSKYTQVNMSFTVANPSPANGPTSLVLSYSTNGGATFATAQTITVLPIAPTVNTFNFTGLTSTTGNTIFRLTGLGAKNDSSGASLNYTNITFTGCTQSLPPTITKVFSPGSVALNGTSNLSFTLTNPNQVAIPLTGLAFNDVLPAGLTVVSGTSAQCGGTLTMTAPSTISFSGGSLAASSSCIISASVSATTAGPHQNVSGFVSSTQTGSNTGAGGIATASLFAVSPPAISKLFATNPILSGGVTTLTFTITNPNINNTLSGVAFNDIFPATMVVANPVVATVTGCGAPAFTPVAGANSISFSNGTLAPAGTCTVKVNVTATASGVNTSGNVSHVINGFPANGNTATDTLAISPPYPKVSILKQTSANPAGPWQTYLTTSSGSSVYYQFTVENPGNVDLANISVSDPILTSLGLSMAGCNWANLPKYNAVTCAVGPITAASGSLVNTATATGQYGGNPYTASSSATYAIAGLAILKNATQTYFTAAGNILNYSYLISNTGFAPLVGPVLVSDNKTPVTCPSVTTIGNMDNFLNPGETLTCTAAYTVTATDVSTKLVTNTASASVGGISTIQVNKTVPLAADLTIQKTNNVGGATTVGNTFNWTLTVTNTASAGAATFPSGTALLTDTLVSGSASYIIQPTASNAAGTTGTISCAIASSSILTCSASGGAVSIPSGGSFSLAIAVTPTADGIFSNPPAGGMCRVNASAIIPEISTANNDCIPNIVTIAYLIPQMNIVKSVSNLTTASTGATARPGDTLRYTLTVTLAVASAQAIYVTDNMDNNLNYITGSETFTLPPLLTVGSLEYYGRSPAFPFISSSAVIPASTAVDPAIGKVIYRFNGTMGPAQQFIVNFDSKVP